VVLTLRKANQHCEAVVAGGSSGDYITIEAVTHHAGDDIERMVKGDPG
jgi:hypothetical protein